MITETYTATGGQTVFTFTFDLISAAYLTVSLNDSPQTDWSLTGPHEITLGPSVTVQTGDLLSFSRSTPVDSPLVDFTAPSSIRAREINLAIEQLLHHLQETDAISVDGLGKTPAETAWDARALTISNLASPDSDDDAATRGWVNGQIVASGQLPPVGSADAGKHVGVNAAGTGYALLPADGTGGLMTLDLSTATNTVINQRQGQLAVGKTLSFLATRADVIDLSDTYKVSFEPPVTVKGFNTAPTWDPSTQKLTLPAGKTYRLKMNATASNLLSGDGSPFFQNSAVLQINNANTGQALAAQTVFCGIGSSTNSGNIVSGTFCLDKVVDTSSGALEVDVRFARYFQNEQMALSVPAQLFVEEVL